MDKRQEVKDLIAQGKFVRDMLKELKEHLSEFGPNIELWRVSWKFHRKAKSLGLEFSDLIEELRLLGFIRIERNHKMTRFVYLEEPSTDEDIA